MTNEEKLAEIRQDLTYLRKIRKYSIELDHPVVDRLIALRESDLASLTAPRGKTVKARVPVVVASSGTVLTRYWSTLCGPGDSGETRPYHSDEHTVWIDVDLPLREVPVVEGTVAE